MAMSPRNRKLSLVHSEPTSTYYVYDDTVVDHLGRVPIKSVVAGERTIDLTADQARYFLTQGVIGAKPLSKVSPETRAVLHQLTGGGVPKGAEAKPTPTPTKPAA
jgi:hypothetical protein